MRYSFFVELEETYSKRSKTISLTFVFSLYCLKTGSIFYVDKTLIKFYKLFDNSKAN